jgi:phosphomevalonate kinase
VAAGDAGELLAAVDRSADLLVRLGEALDLPIVTPALARLVATARRAGAAAKPSGAGAGDCGIALATSAAQAAAVEEGWRAAGIVPLGLTIDEGGARADVGGEEAARA